MIGIQRTPATGEDINFATGILIAVLASDLFMQIAGLGLMGYSWWQDYRKNKIMMQIQRELMEAMAKGIDKGPKE